MNCVTKIIFDSDAKQGCLIFAMMVTKPKSTVLCFVNLCMTWKAMLFCLVHLIYCHQTCTCLYCLSGTVIRAMVQILSFFFLVFRFKTCWKLSTTTWQQLYIFGFKTDSFSFASNLRKMGKYANPPRF